MNDKEEIVTTQGKSRVVNFRLSLSIHDKVDRYWERLGYRTKAAFFEAAVRDFVIRAEQANSELLHAN